MKKNIYYLIAIALFFSSCVTVEPVKLPKPFTDVSMIDYSSLTKKGIYVTESNSVSFDYEAVGSIFVEAMGGWSSKNELVERAAYKGDDTYYSSSSSSKKGKLKKKDVYFPPKLEDAFTILTKKLQEQNADGIINLKISFSSVSGLQREKIVITGMAIRR